MNLSFEQLKSMVVFAQVVEQGNLTAAAKHIGLSRAVVSYHIKKLESQLGVKLLNASIAEEFDLSVKRFELMSDEKPSGLTQENIQARIRGRILMEYSNTLRSSASKFKYSILFRVPTSCCLIRFT